jgi:hypothetical protein
LLRNFTPGAVRAARWLLALGPRLTLAGRRGWGILVHHFERGYGYLASSFIISSVAVASSWPLAAARFVAGLAVAELLRRS